MTIMRLVTGLDTHPGLLMMTLPEENARKEITIWEYGKGFHLS